jgi:hypothetical protein
MKSPPSITARWAFAITEHYPLCQLKINQQKVKPLMICCINLRQFFADYICFIRIKPYFCTPNPKGIGSAADSLENAAEDF